MPVTGATEIGCGPSRCRGFRPGRPVVRWSSAMPGPRVSRSRQVTRKPAPRGMLPLRPLRSVLRRRESRPEGPYCCHYCCSRCRPQGLSRVPHGCVSSFDDRHGSPTRASFRQGGGGDPRHGSAAAHDSRFKTSSSTAPAGSGRRWPSRRGRPRRGRPRSRRPRDRGTRPPARSRLAVSEDRRAGRPFH